MSLTGNSNEEKIWNYCFAKLGNTYGTAGLMGNIYAESGLRPDNLQNGYEKKLGLSDAEYVAQVDSGKYTNFIKDSAGYGLAQWTYWSRKQNLINYAKSKNKSIADLEMQLDFLFVELATYKVVYSTLKNAKSVLEASNIILTQFEKPADQGPTAQAKRASYGQVYYNKYAKVTNNNLGGMTMSNSSLVNCAVKSPNHSGVRTHSIDRITPHCVVGQLTAESIGGCFKSSSREASCNYGIGKDGRVCLVVDEANRSWCSSSSANDQRAITIECASDKTNPYTMNDAVYSKLVDLCVDICKRNGKTKLLWIADKNKSLNYNPASNEMVITVHRWFANKSCPGDWLYNRLGDLANQVTSRLGGSVSAPVAPTPSNNSNFPATPFTVQVLVSDLNFRNAPSMSGAVKGQTGKSLFTIVEVKDGWGKLKSGAGWIYLENASYVSIKKTTAAPAKPAASSGYAARVIASVLNVRKGPGTNYGISCTIKKNEVYTIVQESNGWGKLKSGAGWVSLHYVQKI